MQVQIQDIKGGLIRGVEVYLDDESGVYREGFFQWSESALTAAFQSTQISGGVIRAWHHTPIFSQVETHEDREMFYFVSGTALMLFADVDQGKVDMGSAQIVRIPCGCQIVIDAGKAHFVAVAEGDDPVKAVVVAPKMPAPRIDLCECIEGIV